jgi:hypothetical protein
MPLFLIIRAFARFVTNVDTFYRIPARKLLYRRLASLSDDTPLKLKLLVLLLNVSPPGTVIGDGWARMLDSPINA